MLRNRLLKLHSIAAGAASRSLNKAAKPPPSPIKNPPINPWPKHLDSTSLLAILSRQENPELALQIFHYAGESRSGFSHTYDTYLFIIRRLSRFGAFHAVDSLLDDLQRSGLKCGEFAFIAVIRSYGLAGLPEKAVETFLRMENFEGVKRSARSLNSLLNALIQNELYDSAWSVFEKSKESFGVVPNAFTGNILMKLMCKKGDFDGALNLLDEMPKLGLVPNVVCYVTLMKAHVSEKDWVNVERVFDLISARGLEPDAGAHTALMDGYVKQGRLSEAEKVMDEMEEKWIPKMEATYDIMISAYCSENMPEKALSLLSDMIDYGKYTPSSALCLKVIDALCEQGKLEEALSLWRRFLKNIHFWDNAVCGTLISWLCKGGKTKDARKLFEEHERVSVPSLSTYNSLVEGICEEGEPGEAEKLMRESMAKKGVEPDSLTYGSLVRGFCGNEGARDGLRIVIEMLRKGFVPEKLTCALLYNRLRESGEEGDLTRALSLAMSSGEINRDYLIQSQSGFEPKSLL